MRKSGKRKEVGRPKSEERKTCTEVNTEPQKKGDSAKLRVKTDLKSPLGGI